MQIDGDGLGRDEYFSLFILNLHGQGMGATVDVVELEAARSGFTHHATVVH